MFVIRKSNGYAAIVVLVLIAVILIAFYSMMKPFAMTYEKLGKHELNFTTQTSCENSSRVNDGYWYDDESKCYDLPERADLMMQKIRYYWLLAPLVLIIGLLVWLVTMAVKDDPQTYYMR